MAQINRKAAGHFLNKVLVSDRQLAPKVSHQLGQRVEW